MLQSLSFLLVVCCLWLRESSFSCEAFAVQTTGSRLTTTPLVQSPTALSMETRVGHDIQTGMEAIKKRIISLVNDDRDTKFGQAPIKDRSRHQLPSTSIDWDNFPPLPTMMVLVMWSERSRWARVNVVREFERQ